MKQNLLKEILSRYTDEKNKAFSNKLKINKEYEILGLKVPQLKQIAKQIVKEDGIDHIYDFFKYKNKLYYEEVVVTYFTFSFLCNKIEYSTMVKLLDKLLKYNNSWATNDLLALAIKPSKKINELFYSYLVEKSKSQNPWDIRFSVINLMKNYLDDIHIDKTLLIYSNIKNDEYYVIMALGWAFATALAKNRDKTYPYIFNNQISPNVNKIAIQKAIESRRISLEDKDKLKELRSKLKETV